MNQEFIILGLGFVMGGAVGFLVGLLSCLWIAATELGLAMEKAGEQ